MRWTRIVLAALLAACFAGAARAQQPVKLRVAYIVPGVNLFSIFTAKPELLRHHGKSYTLDAIRFQATPQMITGLAVGELEIALLNSTSLSLGVENASMEDLRLFADEFRDGVEGYHTNVFMVRNADGPRTAAEVKGKIVATNAIGSMVDIAARAWLRKAGLEERRDYTMVEAQLATMKALLFDKKIDVNFAAPPFLYDPELQANARVLFSSRDAMGPSELGVWGARDEFLKKNRAAVVDFLEDTMRVTRWFIDPVNNDEAIRIAAAAAKAPESLFKGWLFTKKDYYRDPELLPDVAAIQSNIELQASLGFVKGKLDVKKHVDLSYIEAAKARLR